MNRLVPRISWVRVAGDGDDAVALEERLVPLLRAIATSGTLMAAARALAIPYRSAWALLEAAQLAAGVALVASTRGRGAVLTPLAERLLAADARVCAFLAARGAGVDIPLAARSGADRGHRLAVAASHDIALAQMRDAWRLRHGIVLEFHGSLESIAAYLAGRVDLAGFHVPARAGPRDPLLAQLSPSRDVRIRFLRREQGLILPAGNPARVRRLRDLARKRARFVNRQPGSGTRLLLDRLLEKDRVDPADLSGYTNEEFTHAAVAATVAAGNADAGFGIRAAAAQFGLAFVPLAEERYFFACRRRALNSAAVARFRALLASPATRAVVEPLPGYALDAPGEPEDLPVARRSR